MVDENQNQESSDSDQNLGPGSEIGPYTLISRLGTGGFGDVFRAHQDQPVKRDVALKVIKPGMDSREIVTRFEAERQALALMDHPNIAKVYDAGTTERGLPYFVMEVVEGISLTRYCDEKKLSIRQRLELFIQICRGVQHAHQKGIVHRDLKPANILVSEHDGKPVAKVIDFGVAKALHAELTEQTFHTMDGQMIGTTQYMSPEQIKGDIADIDTRSDIYALGVILYELLTGEAPIPHDEFVKAGYMNIIQLICEKDAPSASACIRRQGETAATVAEARSTGLQRLMREVKGDLNSIMQKAVEKDRERRYETATSLADDVKRYLRNETVSAQPPTLRYRLGKYARRNKLVLIAGILILATLVAGVAVSSVFAWMAQKNANEATAARQMAEWESDALRARAQINTDGDRALRDIKNVVDQFRQSYPNRPLPLSIQESLASVLDQCRATFVKRSPHSDTAFRMLLLGDQRTVALASKNKIQFLDLRSGRFLNVYQAKATNPIVDIATTGNHGLVAVSFANGGLSLIDPREAESREKWQVQQDHTARFLRYISTKDQLVSICPEGMARFWNLEGRTLNREVSLPVGALGDVAFDDDGERVAVTSALEPKWQLIQISGHEITSRDYISPGSTPTAVSISGNGNTVAVGMEDGIIEIWSGETLQRKLIGHTSTITSLAFIQADERLASADNSGDIRYWALNTGKEAVPTMRGHRSGVVGLGASLNSRFLISADKLPFVRAWDLQGLQANQPLRRPRGPRLRSIAFGKEENHLLGAIEQERLVLWDWRLGVEIASRPINGSGHNLITNHDRSLAAYYDYSDSSLIDIFQTDTLKSVAKINGLPKGVKSIVFHPRLNCLYACSGKFQLYQIAKDNQWSAELMTTFNQSTGICLLSWPRNQDHGSLTTVNGFFRFSETGVILNETRLPVITPPNLRGAAWSGGELDYLAVRRGDGDGNLVLLGVAKQGAEILAETQAFNNNSFQTTYNEASKRLAGADKEGRFLIFGGDARLAPVFQSGYLPSSSADVVAHPSLDVVAVGTRYEDIYFWGTSPYRWEGLLEERLENSLPEKSQSGANLFVPPDLTYETQPANDIVHADRAGIRIAAHRNWKKVQGAKLSVFHAISRRIGGSHFEKATFVGAFERTEKHGASNNQQFLDTVFVFEFAHPERPEQLPDLIRAKLPSFVNTMKDPTLLNGVIRMDPDTLIYEWIADPGYLELVLQGTFNGKPIQFQANWRPTDRAAVYLVSFLQLPEPGGASPLSQEIRHQLMAATIRSQNKVDNDPIRIAALNREFDQLLVETVVRQRETRWTRQNQLCRVDDKSAAINAAAELVAMAESYQLKISPEEARKWQIRAIESRNLLADLYHETREYQLRDSLLMANSTRTREILFQPDIDVEHQTALRCQLAKMLTRYLVWKNSMVFSSEYDTEINALQELMFDNKPGMSIELAVAMRELARTYKQNQRPDIALNLLSNTENALGRPLSGSAGEDQQWGLGASIADIAASIHHLENRIEEALECKWRAIEYTKKKLKQNPQLAPYHRSLGSRYCAAATLIRARDGDTPEVQSLALKSLQAYQKAKQLDGNLAGTFSPDVGKALARHIAGFPEGESKNRAEQLITDLFPGTRTR